MKKLLFFSVLLFVFASCQKEEIVPVPDIKADFSYSIEGKVPDAKLVLINLSLRADDYVWEFDEDLGRHGSTLEHPGSLSVKEPGTYTISLAVKNWLRESDMVSKTLIIE